MSKKYFTTITLAVALLASLVIVSAGSVAADGSDPGNHKVVVTGLTPGSLVAGYLGGFPFQVTDHPTGMLGPSVTSYGEDAQLQIPLHQFSSIWVQSPGGSWQLLAVLSPSQAFPDTILNAQQPLMLAQAPAQEPSRGPGLAAPEAAAQPSSRAATIQFTLPSASVSDGSSITVKGTGALSNRPVRVALIPFGQTHANAISEVTANPSQDGSFQASLNIPSDLTAGQYSIRSAQINPATGGFTQYWWESITVQPQASNQAMSKQPTANPSAGNESMNNQSTTNPSMSNQSVGSQATTESQTTMTPSTTQ